MDRTYKSTIRRLHMSNSGRIEAATRQHVGAVLTAEQIAELVKLSDPTSSKGVYPSDAAYKRDETGKLVPRGKTAYGDGVLELIAPNSYKVLPTEQIVRRKPLVVSKTEAAPAAPSVAAKTEAKPTASKPVGKKKSKSTSDAKPPVAPKSKANLARAIQ
jgi:hypothetical protein